MSNGLPRVRKIKALAGRQVGFSLDDGRDMVADLSGLIARVRGLAALEADVVFRKVKPVHNGMGAGWPGGNEPEVSAVTLISIAEAQRNVDGAEFASWMRRHRLKAEEAAKVFDVSIRTVRRWSAAEAVPVTTAIMMRSADEDPALIGALLSRATVAA